MEVCIYMAIQGEQYSYKISLKYIDSSNVEVEIDPEQLQYILIDKDYDNTNMPVITLFGSIEKNILDDMILHMNENLLVLGIYKYDTATQGNNITDKYFQDKFIYIINEDLSKTEDLDNPSGIDSKEGNQQYKEVTIFMLQQSAVNNNRQVINGVYHNASMNSLILQCTNYLGNMLLEPLKYDTKYPQIIIPPIDSLSGYIKFLNDNLGTFYDSSYRFFIDFDSTYLVSSSGNAVRARNQYIYTIVIDIRKITPDVSEEPGAYVDLRTGKYTIGIDASKVNYNVDKVINKLINKVTVINSNGDIQEQVIDNNKAKITTEINKIMNVSNNDTNSINQITYHIGANKDTYTIVKNDLDASLFTLNKEYIINDPLHEIYNSRYVITHNQQLFIKQGESSFIMSTVLKLRRSEYNK